MLPQALEDLNYTESESGWLGFGNSIAGIAGGVLVGPVTDIFFKVLTYFDTDIYDMFL